MNKLYFTVYTACRRGETHVYEFNNEEERDAFLATQPGAEDFILSYRVITR